MLIESDNVAKAIVDLIPILIIRKLVVGISKPNLRYHIFSDKVFRVMGTLQQSISKSLNVKHLFQVRLNNTGISSL